MTTPYAAALQAGQRRYQGAPCAAGHAGERYTSTRGCCECVLVKKREERSRKTGKPVKPRRPKADDFDTI